MIGYLPGELAKELHRWAPAEVSDSEMYDLARIAEQVYARGYDDGHRRGYDEGHDAQKRPNINDVNRLREAIATGEGTADRG